MFFYYRDRPIALILLGLALLAVAVTLFASAEVLGGVVVALLAALFLVEGAGRALEVGLLGRWRR